MADTEKAKDAAVIRLPVAKTAKPLKDRAWLNAAKKAPEWSDWHWQLRNAAHSAADLQAQLSLTSSESAGATNAERDGLPIGISPYYLSLCDPADAACPVRMQCVPRAEESVHTAGDLEDPLGEIAHEVAPHLVQRYPDRVLLLVTDRCAVYCRFCTRSRMVGDGGGAVSIEALGPALQYIRENEAIHDVIISGGDPLAMSTDKLEPILAAVRAIAHVGTIRLATRVPVTLPMRITSELVTRLRAHHPVWIMTHFNHPKEVTPEAKAACEMLADAGFPVMNQSVLLRGINDDASVLEQLFRSLVRMRVRPYYLLQTDPVAGTGHLRTPLQRGVDIMAALQGRLSGIAIPKFICDTPGGHGKVPLRGGEVLESTLASDGTMRTALTTFRGKQVEYIDPPAPEVGRPQE
jgi:lysine 2,3-aminomutase